MSLECSALIPEAHSKQILCVQYNPFRREIYTGDSLIKIWESESGKLLQTLNEHTGWITNLLFCKELKILFSCSIDGILIAWSQSGKALQKIHTGSPIYCLAFNSRRQQLLAGFNKSVRVFQFTNTEDSHQGSEVLESKSVACKEHTDVVSCMVSCEGKYYSGGYDRKIVIYDISHHGDMKLKVARVVKDAHEAAITCMIYGKNADNSWLITGSFDRVVKLWSLDGTLLQRFDGFNDTIVAMTYVLPTQTLWISANSTSPIVYDPRSGINVTDFTSVDEEIFNPKTSSFAFKHLLYTNETNQIIGITNRRSIVVWKYNLNAVVTVLGGHNDSVECLAFTSKEPVLIFSGADDGIVRKWERLQLNTFMYSQEPLIVQKEDLKHLTDLLNQPQQSPTNTQKHPTLSKRQTEKNLVQEKRKELHRRVTQKLENWKQNNWKIDNMVHGKVNELVSSHAKHTFKIATSKGIEKGSDGGGFKGLSKGGKAMVENGNTGPNAEFRKENALRGEGNRKPSVLSLYYYEELDIIVAGSEDNKIYVFGYNEDTFKISEPKVEDTTNIELGESMVNPDSVTNRVAGMSLKFILNEHKDAITGLVCLMREGKHYMLSTGWDRRILVWDIQEGKLIDKFRNIAPGTSPSQNSFPLPTSTATEATKKKTLKVNLSSSVEELAADDIVLGIEYCEERNEFGYCSADKQAFSPNGAEMTLQVVLQGHEAEVTQIKWSARNQTWVTGSEDRTIRIWPADGIPCLRVINNDAPITALCIDTLNGCIITGGSNVIRVFDTTKNDEIVQKNIGHTDEIKSIIHVSVRNQYVSGSWDNTLRVWNAYIKPGQKKGIVNVIARSAEEADQGFNLNGLTQPRNIQAFITTPVTEVANNISTTIDDYSVTMEQMRLEDELTKTINDFESVLENGRPVKVKRKASLKMN